MRRREHADQTPSDCEVARSKARAANRQTDTSIAVIGTLEVLMTSRMKLREKVDNPQKYSAFGSAYARATNWNLKFSERMFSRYVSARVAVASWSSSCLCIRKVAVPRLERRHKAEAMVKVDDDGVKKKRP